MRSSRVRARRQSRTPYGVLQPPLRYWTSPMGPVRRKAVATPGVGRRSLLNGSLRCCASSRHAPGERLAFRMAEDPAARPSSGSGSSNGCLEVVGGAEGVASTSMGSRAGIVSASGSSAARASLRSTAAGSAAAPLDARAVPTGTAGAIGRCRDIGGGLLGVEFAAAQPRRTGRAPAQSSQRRPPMRAPMPPRQEPSRGSALLAVTSGSAMERTRTKRSR